MPTFYELDKQSRDELVLKIHSAVSNAFNSNDDAALVLYFEDEDTYIRKSAYLSVGKIFLQNKKLQTRIIEMLNELRFHDSFKIRQTVINAVGEIGKKDFELVQHFFDEALFDEHHAPRNAVIGSIKKMGEVNPSPVLTWSKKYLHHPDKEIRREICHGIELRGRKHPQDILPLLKELQFDATSRVRNTLVHVIGQIAYKKGCLEIVIADLKSWENQKLVEDAIAEIIDVHHRYRNFSAYTQDEAKLYIQSVF
ncbi:MAG: HEAT repeat domain-containing protein [Sphingobacteriales bacterium]|nr:HEAT repeat domain-containing protein [Sphingobacteriales bacterium]